MEPEDVMKARLWLEGQKIATKEVEGLDLAYLLALYGLIAKRQAFQQAAQSVEEVFDAIRGNREK